MKTKHHSCPAFTLLELMVAITLVAILTTISIAAVDAVTSRAKGVDCLNNLRQIGHAAMLYAAENQGELPATQHNRRLGSWVASLQEYTGKGLNFKCRDDPRKQTPYSYAVNDHLTPPSKTDRRADFSSIQRIPSPSSTLYFAEVADGYEGSDHFHFTGGTTYDAFAEQVAVERHRGSANYLYADGHAETLRATRIRELLEEGGSRFLVPNEKK